MASNWRMNVFNLGLNNSIYDLISGEAGFPGVYFARLPHAAFKSYDILNFPSFLGNLPVIVGSGVYFGPKNWPYELPVDPD